MHGWVHDNLVVELNEIERGVSARELRDLRPESRRWITRTALEGWLVASGFAEPNGEPGRLVPMQRAIDVGGALAFFG